MSRHRLCTAVGYMCKMTIRTCRSSVDLGDTIGVGNFGVVYRVRTVPTDAALRANNSPQAQLKDTAVAVKMFESLQVPVPLYFLAYL